MSYWKTINKNLSGQNGFIYLMFLGRETTGKKVVNDITRCNHQILAVPKDQVYASISFLEKRKYLYQIKKEGRSKIRTSLLKPTTESFQHFDWEYDEEAIKTVGKYMTFFPEYCSYFLQTREATIRNKEWSYLFETLYYPFLRDLAGIAFSKIFDFISSEINGDWLRKVAINLVIKTWERGFKARSKTAPTHNLKEAVRLQTKIVEQLPPNKQRILAEYSWQIANNPLADILEKSPKEWEEFQKFINSTISKTFSRNVQVQ